MQLDDRQSELQTYKEQLQQARQQMVDLENANKDAAESQDKDHDEKVQSLEQQNSEL